MKKFYLIFSTIIFILMFMIELPYAIENVTVYSDPSTLHMSDIIINFLPSFFMLLSIALFFSAIKRIFTKDEFNISSFISLITIFFVKEYPPFILLLIIGIIMDLVINGKEEVFNMDKVKGLYYYIILTIFFSIFIYALIDYITVAYIHSDVSIMEELPSTFVVLGLMTIVFANIYRLIKKLKYTKEYVETSSLYIFLGETIYVLTIGLIFGLVYSFNPDGYEAFAVAFFFSTLMPVLSFKGSNIGYAVLGLESNTGGLQTFYYFTLNILGFFVYAVYLAVTFLVVYVLRMYLELALHYSGVDINAVRDAGLYNLIAILLASVFFIVDSVLTEESLFRKKIFLFNQYSLSRVEYEVK